MKKILLVLCIFFSGFLITTQVLADEPPKAKVVGVDTDAGSYELLSPIGNLSSVPDVSENGFQDYINLLITIAIAVAGAITVIIIIVSGIQYMGTDSVWEKGESKAKMGSAIGGLVLILCSYIILYTINPDLVNIKIGFSKINEGSWDYISFGEEQAYRVKELGKVKFERTKHYDTVKNFVASHSYAGYPDKIPHCLAQVAILRETAGNETLIGHDENAPYGGIPSRVDFVKSGKKYSGTTFPTTGTQTTDRKFLNDDNASGNIYSASNPSAENLGLDWRFSHGIGLMQITFFPSGSKRGANWDKGFTTQITKKTFKVKDMLNANNAIEAGVELLQYNYKKCNKDILNTYKAYGSGDCNSKNSFVLQEAPIRKQLYDECVAQDK